MNYLVAHFSQDRVMSSRIDRNPEAAELGACHCFALHWLRRVLSNSSEFPSVRLAKLKRDGGGLNLLLNDVYCRHCDHISVHEIEESDRMVLRLRGLEVLCLTIPWGGYDRSRLIKNVRCTEGGFVYSYHFKEKNNSHQEEQETGHSIAFYSSSATGGLIYAFDANFGEFHITPKNLSPFWQMHLALHYGPPYRHMLRQLGVADRDHVSRRRASSSGG